MVIEEEVQTSEGTDGLVDVEDSGESEEVVIQEPADA